MIFRSCQVFKHRHPLTRRTALIFQRFKALRAGLATELEHRGLLSDLTASQAVFTTFLEKPRVVYSGVDPTADSLHLGNLVPLVTLLHFQLGGHQPIALLGGATALVGDPSGRDEERPAQSAVHVMENSAKIEKQLLRFFENAHAYARRRSAPITHPQQSLKLLNNLAWWQNLTLVDFLHSTGKFVRLNGMLSKDSVKTRMATSNGMSFAEFSYQLLQAYDFWYLYKHHECKIQVGGSDQWGNIVAGLDIIVRRETNTMTPDRGGAYGVTTPLLTTSSGQKFGKSAGNAIWLDPQKTSIFDFYQFFLRIADADVEKYLKILTLLGLDEVESLMLSHRSQPESRSAQRKLANEMTEMVHGVVGLKHAQAATSLLFDTELAHIRPEDVAEALKPDPRYHALEETELLDIPVTKLACSSGLTRSRAEAVRLIEAGGLYLNNVPVRTTERRLQAEDLLGNQIAILRAGRDKHIVLALK